MAGLVLKGAPLRAVAALAGFAPVRRLLWAASAPDFGVAEVAALPASARLPLDDAQRPVAGRAPHTWAHGGHDVAAAPRATVASLSDAFRSGRTTPRAVLEAWIAAVEAGRFGEATFSPFVALDLDRARADADAATARHAAGAPLGPLDGVIVPVKDEVELAGVPTRGGTRYRTAVATTDGGSVRRLRAAGAVVAAKTHATEWGMNPWGGNAWHDLPRNVWSRSHGAGGSSTGSGVAVALGLAPVALGSDGGGSIRIPAALNGVFGLKPTFVRIGRTGDSWQDGTSMSHLGPLGGSVPDLVEFLLATAGVDPDDPATTYAPDRHDVASAWRSALGRGVRGARIGVPDAEWADAEPAAADAAREALGALERDGAVLVPLDLPLLRHAPGVGALVIGSETAANLADDFAVHGHLWGPELAIIARLMGELRAQDLLAFSRVRAALRRQVAAAFARHVDLIALPTTAGPARPYGLDTRGTDVLAPPYTAAMTRFAFLGNLTGLPAGTVPAGRVGALPVGLQLVGDAWDEASVIAGMAAAERSGVTALGRPDGFWDPLEAVSA